MMFYYGANRSGRWAGRIVQPQNLPQNHLPELDLARQLVKKLDAEMLKVCYGSVPDTLSQLIRTAFIPKPGKLYAVADYSAIEARVVAWLAGESWVLDAFKEGKDIYCATASQMFGVPVEKHGVNSELRQRGKVATLALGYGGGESALVAMGALKMGIPEGDLPEIKAKWRQANPAICGLWRKIEDAAILCVRTGERQAVPVKIHDPARARENETRTGATMGTYSDYFNTGVGITFRREADFDTNQDFLTIELPTRRKLFYAHPQLLPARNFPERESLHYMSTNQSTKKWGLTDTWGGKLVENITQAVARDCLAETLLRLKRKGLTAVFHVHDEVIVEVDRADQLNDILDIMAEPLDWAPGLPLKGAGFCCEYYQKD
jgi:DNA polymerase